MKTIWKNQDKSAIALSIALLITSCTTTPSTLPASGQPQAILIDGSSTVFPITDEVVKEYQFEHSDAPEITVGVSGTTGGFRKFCAGETDISNASRPIKQEEMDACRARGIRYIELPVAFDALTVVVNPENTWATSMTLEELKTIWEPAAQGKITRWNQVRASWPNQPLNLYGPGRDSGTFDYFTEVVVGEAQSSRTDYTASEDDTLLVRGVRNDPNALGYFGYAYYEESQRALKSVDIDSGSGPISPSPETVINAQYHPLARPLFIYVNADSAQKNSELRAFVDFYMTRANNLVNLVGYVPLPDEAYAIALSHFQTGKVGTVFAGQSQPNLTIKQLLEKEAAF